MTSIDADNAQIVSCMICGTRFDNMLATAGHLNDDGTCTTGTHPAADITATEAKVFATLLAAEDKVRSTKASVAMAPAMLTDKAWAGLKANYDTARAEAARAVTDALATLGPRAAKFSDYRQLAQYAATL
jgi:hypothetical protein